jgi:hypothetical protein
MIKTCYLIITVFVIYYSAAAQKQFINGIIQDSLTHFPIRAVKVSNTATKKIAYSNSKGIFSIEAGPGEVIVTSYAGYKSYSITYSTLVTDTIKLYLSSVATTLPTVSISSRYNQYQLDSINRRRDITQMRGGRLNNISRADGFGIVINLDRVFKKKYQYQRKNEKLFKQRERAAYISYRYSPQLVAYYTGLRGEELANFLEKHTPSYEWLRKHTLDEQVFDYINGQLKLFKAHTK